MSVSKTSRLKVNTVPKVSSTILNPLSNSATSLFSSWSTKSPTNSKNDDDDWNDAWESAWLPEDLTGKNRAPWETDVNFPSMTSTTVMPSDVDPDTKAFVEDMNENWNERRRAPKNEEEKETKQNVNGDSLYSLETMKKDYRLKKQRIHAGLWVKEIEKQEEAKLGDSGGGVDDDIERLLDSCSEMFDSVTHDFNNTEGSGCSDFKSKPDGWETTSKAQDENVWEMSQREEDILLQEFDRRIAYCKFQIASFIKQHIFSRRRPIDGWKYMIEEIGPNAKKGKGSVSRLPSLSDASTQPFKEEKTPISGNLTPLRGR